jgi:hypothetical protein
MEQRHLRDKVSHAVRDDGDFRLARFGRIPNGGNLVASEHVVEIAENVGEIIGACARFCAVREIIINLPFRWPGKENTDAKTIRAGKESVADVRIEIDGARKTVVVTVNAQGEMFFFFLLIWRKVGELIAGFSNGFTELRKGNALPVGDIVKIAGAVADKVSRPVCVSVSAHATIVSVTDHPILRHNKLRALCSVVASLSAMRVKQFVNSWKLLHKRITVVFDTQDD